MAKRCLHWDHGCLLMVSDKSKSGECTNCQSAYSRWKDREPYDRLERTRKLDLYSTRMSGLYTQKELRMHIRENLETKLRERPVAKKRKKAKA